MAVSTMLLLLLLLHQEGDEEELRIPVPAGYHVGPMLSLEL